MVVLFVICPLCCILSIPCYRRVTKWKWSADCQKAFDSAKKSLKSSSVLCSLRSLSTNQTAADASSYGKLGACSPFTCVTDGTEVPIAFASRTLSSSEKKDAPK